MVNFLGEMEGWKATAITNQSEVFKSLSEKHVTANCAVRYDNTSYPVQRDLAVL